KRAGGVAGLLVPRAGREVRDHRDRDGSDPAVLPVPAEALRQGRSHRLSEGVTVNRRQVLAGAAALPLLPGLPARRRPGPAEVALSWLEGKPGAAATSTWGTPWPQGAVPGDQTFRLAGPDGGD